MRAAGTSDTMEKEKWSFACPVFKNDPVQHAGEIYVKFGTIAHMKQHVHRVHCRPQYTCTRCDECFSSDDRLQNHRQHNPGCIANPSNASRWLDENQENQLRIRLANGTPEEQWRKLYQSLFPQVDDYDVPSPFFESRQAQLRLLSRHLVEEGYSAQPNDSLGQQSPLQPASSPAMSSLDVLSPGYEYRVSSLPQVDLSLDKQDLFVRREPDPQSASLSGHSSLQPPAPPTPSPPGNNPLKSHLPTLRQTREDDNPYTDSGYESAGGLLYPSMHENDPRETHQIERSQKHMAGEMDVNDGRTSYSVATAILPEVAEKCVVDVCNNIHSRLQGAVSKRTLMSLSKILPDLIKAFAVKLGSDMPLRSNLRVMHFVHKHHKYLVSHLQNKFVYDDNVSQSPRKSTDIMPLSEIMSMWSQNHDKELLVVEPSEYFEGLSDDEDDGDNDPVDEEGDASALLGYSQMIVNSAAYDWLISSLVKEASFHWAEAEPRTMVDQIRQEILSQLPTGRISSRHPPDRHTVSFKIPRSSLSFLLEDSRASPTPSPTTMIADRIVAISSSADHVQLSKISQYMDQTWPLGGTILSSVLQNAINGRGQNGTSSTRESNTKIEIFLDGNYLETCITGTSYSIAEYGEQLAWLTAALQPAVPGLTTCVRPFMRSLKDDTYKKAKRNSWLIEVETETTDDTDIPAWAVEEWMCDTRSPVIVRGFPTLGRPKNCPGIEVPQELPVGLLPRPIYGNEATHFFLPRTGRILQLFEQTKGVTIWHILGSQQEVCTCRQRLLKDNGKEHLLYLSFVELWQHRHIITECSVAKLLHRDTIPQTGPGLGSADTSQQECSLSEATQLTPYSENATDSLNSREADMLSIADSSEYGVGGSSETNDAALAIIEEVASRLVSEYRQYTEQRNPASDCHNDTNHCSPGGQQSFIPQDSSQSTLTQASSTSSIRKRPAEQDDGDGDGDEDSQRRPMRKKLKHKDSGKGPQFFACPFWKQNPGKHSNCFGKKLSTISRVKQHLDRSHSPDYCDRCLGVFRDNVHKLVHLRNEQSLCSFQLWAPLDGLTSEQQRSLRRKSDSRLDESQKWFAVWDIVFPTLCRPSSPYLNSELSRDLNHFREFSERRGPILLVEVLREEGLVAQECDDELIHRAAYRAIRSLFAEGMIDRASILQTTDSVGSASADVPGSQQYSERRLLQESRLTDQGSIADSAVELRSQLSSDLVQGNTIQPPYTSIQPRPLTDGGADMGIPQTPNQGAHAAYILNSNAYLPQLSVDRCPIDTGDSDIQSQLWENYLDPESQDLHFDFEEYDLGE